MTIESIKNVLLSNGYTMDEAVIVAGELYVLSAPLVPLFEKWAADGTEQDYQSHELSVLEIKDLLKMTYPAALLTIDWIIKEPETALKAIMGGIK